MKEWVTLGSNTNFTHTVMITDFKEFTQDTFHVLYRKKQRGRLPYGTMNLWLLAADINELNEGRTGYWNAPKGIDLLLDMGILEYADENVRDTVRVRHTMEERSISIKAPYLTAVHEKPAG